MPNLLHSSDTGQKPNGNISNFLISGQFFINKNSHDPRISNDIDMILELVNKVEKGNTAILKTFDKVVMSENYDVIVIFPTYVQFGASRF